MPKKANAPTNAHLHMQGNTTIARPKKAHAPTNTHLHMKADKTLSRPKKANAPTNTHLHIKEDKTTSSTKTADTSTHTRPHMKWDKTISRPKKADTPSTHTHLRMNGDKTLSRPKKADTPTNTKADTFKVAWRTATIICLGKSTWPSDSCCFSGFQRNGAVPGTAVLPRDRSAWAQLAGRFCCPSQPCRGLRPAPQFTWLANGVALNVEAHQQKTSYPTGNMILSLV